VNREAAEKEDGMVPHQPTIGGTNGGKGGCSTAHLTMSAFPNMLKEETVSKPLIACYLTAAYPF